MTIDRAQVERILADTPYAAFEEVFGIRKGIIRRDGGSESFVPMGKTWRAVYLILVKDGKRKKRKRKGK
jgi:hypothetical protein